MAKHNKSKLRHMLAQAGGDFNKILAVPSGVKIVEDGRLLGNTRSTTKPMKPATIEKWARKVAK